MSEYKKYKKNYKESSKGLGDTIKKITDATGISKAVKFIAGEDCGCDERQKTLNKAFRYLKPKCLTEGEYNYLISFFKKAGYKLTVPVQKELLGIYNRVFSKNKEISSCGSCINSLLTELKTLLKTYG
tara:strand:+ start:983 stop:1366 length:384 start_codon:yes stop_codon:yes gene_type:complete